MVRLDYFYYIYYLSRLNKSQYLSASKIKAIQDAKLRELIKYTYRNVGYYKRLFDSKGISPADIQTREDICKLPITSREDLRNNPVSEIISQQQKVNNCARYTTSGTTVQPLDIYLSRKEEALQVALYLRMLFANGYKKNMRMAVFTNPQFIKKQKKYIFRPFGIFDIEYFSIFQQPDESFDRLIKFNPDIIRGYTSVIKSIALEARKKGVKQIHPSLIFCTAEFLSRDDRNFISSAFGAEVLDYYSSSECGHIAWECGVHFGYHINSETLILEFLKGDRKALPGEEAEVIITNLDSYAMPFIRYKIGDMAVFSDAKCPCGRQLPFIKEIAERKQHKQLAGINRGQQ